MSSTIHLKISDNIAEGLKGLKPASIRAAIADGMNDAAPYVIANLSKDRLTGNPGRPYPVSAHQLRSITGRLRASVRSTPAEVSGDNVSISIGTAVEYAAAHEFGFSGTVTIPAHARTSRKGNASTVRSHQRAVTIPERAPIRTGITENLNIFNEEIGTAVIAAMKS